VSGQQRQYTLTLPQNYSPNKAYQLIFGYHWLSGTMQDVVSGSYYGIQPLAGDNAIFVAPQGLNNGWGNTNGDDITFTDQMLSTLENALCIDQTQIYSMGWSYGGAMSYALACARPNVFRAVAVMSGANLSGCSPGTQPVAYYAQHGVSDSVLPFSLGEGIRDTFVKDNHCTPTNPPAPAAGSGTHIKTEYSGCDSGHPVWWVAFDGPHEPLATDAGTSSSWTPGQIWSFFSLFH
jgi:poly(3-hydroxybutyrate) depolymerase